MNQYYYMNYINIDNSQVSLIFRLHKLIDIKMMKVDSLNIGDIHVCDNITKDIKFIIERKPIYELINDKKKNYSEEIKHLLLSNHNIYYLIEGSQDKLREKEKDIMVIISDLSYNDKFNVIYTNNIDESINIIADLIY